MDTNITKTQTNETAPGGAEPGASQPEKPGSAAEAENGAESQAGGSLPAKPSSAASDDSGETAAASGKKKYTSAQYALFSAFFYPGAGQLMRGQKRKGWTIIAVFTVFLIWWLIWLALGVLIIYRESSYVGIQYPEAIAEGVSYLKRSLIPGTAVASIFFYAVYDAYKS